jgi:hypothetical protein
MINSSPIPSPPPELVQQWASESLATQHLCTQAARWGADQELEACLKWLTEQTCFHPESALIKDLRAARCPKPPTLKEQALGLLNDSISDLQDHEVATIRRALEALPND